MAVKKFCSSVRTGCAMDNWKKKLSETTRNFWRTSQNFILFRQGFSCKQNITNENSPLGEFLYFKCKNNQILNCLSLKAPSHQVKAKRWDQSISGNCHIFFAFVRYELVRKCWFLLYPKHSADVTLAELLTLKFQVKFSEDGIEYL